MNRKNSTAVIAIMVAVIVGTLAFMHWSRKSSKLPEDWQILFPYVMETLNKSFEVANANHADREQINREIKQAFPDLNLQFQSIDLKFSYISRKDFGPYPLLMMHFLHQGEVYLLGILKFSGPFFPATTMVSSPGGMGPTFHAFNASYDGKVLPVDAHELDTRTEITVLATDHLEPYRVFLLGRTPPRELAAIYAAVLQ